MLGVLLISGEYSTGMIRSTFVAVPKRLPVLWAKAIVYAAVTLALMVPAVLIGFFGSQAILRNHHILELSFSHPGVARTVLGGAVYLTLVGVFALGLGAILRNTAGGIATFAAIMFVIPPLLNILPSDWNNAINPYLPSTAGERDLLAHPRLRHARPVAGIRPLLRLHGALARDRRRPARPPRHLTAGPISQVFPREHPRLIHVREAGFVDV